MTVLVIDAHILEVLHQVALLVKHVEVCLLEQVLLLVHCKLWREQSLLSYLLLILASLGKVFQEGSVVNIRLTL